MRRRIGPAVSADGLRTGSLRLRAAVAVLLLLVLLLGALAVTVEISLGARLRGQIEDRLKDRASAATALVGTVSSGDLAQRLSFQGLSVVIRDSEGDSVTAGPTPAQLKAGPAGGPGLPGPQRRGAVPAESGKAATTGDVKHVTITRSHIDDEGRIITLVSRLSDGSTITLTADASSVGQTLDQLRWVMLGASAGFLLIAAFGLVLVMRISLTPLDRMTMVARSIARGDRGRRLTPLKPHTEIGRVALAFDEMLDAVEGAERTAVVAEARVRAFVSDAAHELRTPVAGMQAAADTLVRARPDADERERLAVHVAREAGRASRLIDDMLMMARVDRGLDLELGRVDLADVVVAEVERQRLRCPEAGVSAILREPRVMVSGDADRLAQVLGNLVDNAVRATKGQGRIDVTVDVDEHGDGVVTVADDGPGVADRQRERIFDRLVRLDAGRDQRSGGVGLGLPIARGIARAHGGDVRCLDHDGGAVFELRLPQTIDADLDESVRLSGQSRLASAV